MDLARAREGALCRAVVLRDRLRLLFGTPVCALADHDPVLRHDATLGWFEVCRRCGCARLLSPAQTG